MATEYVTEVWCPPADSGRHSLHLPMREPEPLPEPEPAEAEAVTRLVPIHNPHPGGTYIWFSVPDGAVNHR